MTELILDFNKIGGNGKGMSILLDMTLKASNLRMLVLRNNDLNDSDAEVLAKLIK
jgi:hypothetical protein